MLCKLRHCEGTLQIALCAIRRTMNARAIICRLPVEVLAEIMKYVPYRLARVLKNSNYYQTPWMTSALDVVSLLPIAQTCHHLREIALSCAALWSTITDDESSQAAVFASRAAASKLNVVLAGKPNPMISALVRREGHRMHEMQWVPDLPVSSDFDSNDGDEEVDFTFLDFAAPALESLSITIPGLGVSSTDAAETLATFCHTSPRLRLLYLCGTSLPGNRFKSLTHLGLSNMSVAADFSLRLLQLIVRCPCLESLSLSQLIAPYGEEPALAGIRLDPVPARCLRRLASVANSIPFTEFVLSHIHCVDSKRVVEVLALPAKSSEDVVVKVLRSSSDPVSCIQISADSKCPSLGATVTAIGSNTAVRVGTLAGRDWSWDNWLRLVLRNIPRPADLQLHELWVQGMPRNDEFGHFDDESMDGWEPADETLGQELDETGRRGILVSIARGLQWTRVLNTFVAVDEYGVRPVEYMHAIAQSWEKSVLDAPKYKVHLVRLVYAKGYPGYTPDDSLANLALYYDSEIRGRGEVGAVELMVPRGSAIQVSEETQKRLQARFKFRIVEFDSVPTMDVPEFCIDPHARQVWHENGHE